MTTDTTLLYVSLALAVAAALAGAWAIAATVGIARHRRIRREQAAWRATLEAWAESAERYRAREG